LARQQDLKVVHGVRARESAAARAALDASLAALPSADSHMTMEELNSFDAVAESKAGARDRGNGGGVLEPQYPWSLFQPHPVRQPSFHGTTDGEVEMEAQPRAALTRWKPLDVELDLALDVGSIEGEPLGGFLYGIESASGSDGSSTRAGAQQPLRGRKEPRFTGPRGTIM
jgi:hypothetical protein